MTLTDCPTNYDPVSFYLMCAYTYYVEDESIVPDYQFDELATWLLENYDTLEHQHKELISKDEMIKKIKPDIILLGNDWKNKKIIGKDFAKKIVFFKRITKYSTTKIINKIEKN